MCGICGTYELEPGRNASREVLLHMLDRIQHRGPDEEGFFWDGALAIGARRLSIIDLQGGSQPMSNEDRSVVLVCNGEIYNYKELAEGLSRRGHRLSSECDTEVILHLYEELGDDCVLRLRGMFAFALWDVRKRRLLLARDRLGIKPLYYADDARRLSFASEIKALLCDPRTPPALDHDGLSSFLSLKYVAAPRTMFAGVKALPPGHLLVCEPGGVKARAYWDLSFRRASGPRRSDQSYAEELESLLRESVRLHLVSDVPFGAFLSGGVDSSTIVALMSQMLDQPVKTFSVGFDAVGAHLDEAPYARRVARQFGAEHHEVVVGARDVVNLAERVIWQLDQPVADEAALANYMVARLASEHVKMVLTGEGGDELFAGYARYAGETAARWVNAAPVSAVAWARRALDLVPGLRRPKIALFALSQRDDLTRLMDWFPLFNREMKAQLLSPDLQALSLARPADAIFAEQLARTDAPDPLSRMLYLDTKLWLPDDLLARGDKMSMAASLEARVPLLDHKLVEWAAALPPDLKLRRLTRKYLLKRVAGKWLPPSIIHRKKQGFPIPMAEWLRGEARDWLHDHLAPATVRRRGLFDPHYVDRLVREHDARVMDHSAQLWGLLSVELWYRVFIDGAARFSGRSEPSAAVGATSL